MRRKGQDARQAIIRHLHYYPWGTTRQISYGVSRAPSTVRKHLRALDEEGMLERRAAGGGQHGNAWEYRLVEEGEP